MGRSDFTKSGTFTAIVFALVVLLLPFAIEQIGEATGLYDFPLQKRITACLARPAAKAKRGVASNSVDWERYRKDLEEFSQWAERCNCAAITLEMREQVEIRVVEKVKNERKIWTVPVASCTSGQVGGKKGYVFISGFDRAFKEGAIIEPSKELCGYEILSIGERTVWLRVIMEEGESAAAGSVRFPEFTRIEKDCIVRGSRKYVARDAFALASGGWLMIDSFLSPSSAVFKILDEKRREAASILCVVIGEKGGR